MAIQIAADRNPRTDSRAHRSSLSYGTSALSCSQSDSVGDLQQACRLHLTENIAWNLQFCGFRRKVGSRRHDWGARVGMRNQGARRIFCRGVQLWFIALFCYSACILKKRTATPPTPL